MRRQAVFLVSLLVFTVITASGCGKKPETNKNNVPDVINVETAKVVTGSLDKALTLTGTLEALNSARIVARSPGKVAGVNVDTGSIVSAGQTLITLEADDLSASLQSSRAGVESAQIALDLAAKQYERGKGLLASGAIAQADFDNNYEGTYKKAEVGLKSAMAALAQSQAKYNDAFIKSPISGIVTEKNINAGELAGSSTPLVTVVNLDSIIVQTSVNEDQINMLQVEQQVEVKVGAVSESAFKGSITSISPAANQDNKVFSVKIQLDNRDHLLKPGMFAEVVLHWTDPPSLLIPREAVVAGDGGSKVFVMDNGAARECKIETGKSDDKNIIVLSGLKQDDEVIVKGLNSLKDGVKVGVQTP